jgi:hypothetical protein
LSREADEYEAALIKRHRAARQASDAASPTPSSLPSSAAAFDPQMIRDVKFLRDRFEGRIIRRGRESCDYEGNPILDPLPLDRVNAYLKLPQAEHTLLNRLGKIDHGEQSFEFSVNKKVSIFGKPSGLIMC